MNSLDLMENEQENNILVPQSSNIPSNISPISHSNSTQNSSNIKFLENMFCKENFTTKNQKNNPIFPPIFENKQSRIQERLMRFNEPQLHEIKEESTILEKSNSTSKILSSKFQSRILTNSLINNSHRNFFYFFYNI